MLNFFFFFFSFAVSIRVHNWLPIADYLDIGNYDNSRLKIKDVVKCWQPKAP